MVKCAEIKIGDLVSYQGHTVRVMSIINGISNSTTRKIF